MSQTRDLVTLLRAANPEHPGQITAAPGQKTELLYRRLVASEMPGRARFRAGRLVFYASAVGVAAVAALAVFIPHGGPLGPAPASAAVLDGIADSVAGTALVAPGSYIYTRKAVSGLQTLRCLRPQDCDSSGAQRRGTQVVHYEEHCVTEMWVDAVGRGRYVRDTTEPTLSPHDQALLAEAGQPTSLTTEPPRRVRRLIGLRRRRWPASGGDGSALLLPRRV